MPKMHRNNFEGEFRIGTEMGRIFEWDPLSIDAAQAG